MTSAPVNIPEKIYSDKFDVQTTSSLSFFLFDQKAILCAKDSNGKIIAVHHISFKKKDSLITSLKEDRIFQLDVPTQIFVHRKYFSLVPGMLFDQSFTDTYLSLSGENCADKHLHHTSLESNNYQLLGAIENDLYTALSKNKTDIQFHHGASSFLSYSLKEKFNLINQELLILIFGHQCYISAFHNQELVLFNWFEFDQKENLLQYLFGINHQLNFDRHYCRVTLFGEWEKLDVSLSWGNEYFKNFKISSPSTNLQYQSGTEIFMESGIFESFWQFQA